MIALRADDVGGRGFSSVGFAQPQALESQSRLANKTLDSIQDVLTTFDTFGYESEFELPSSDPRVAELIADFHKVSQHASAGPPPAGFTPLPARPLHFVASSSASLVSSDLNWSNLAP